MERIKIAERLGIYGWDDMDCVILASLVKKMPMLLVGKHGSGKSMFFERLSGVLGLEYRFYNASLVNYDDLVGVPVPSEDCKSLNFISDSSSIWDAGVVFIDEINRTKPELQNKLFPIIYDRRVQGHKLDKLQYRFAAMNPPTEDEDGEQCYAGVFELDRALVDRFPFVCEVPSWEGLDEEMRMKMMLGGSLEDSGDLQDALNALVDRARAVEEAFDEDFDINVSEYSIRLSDVIGQHFGSVSSRRAFMFKDTFKAVYAAMKVLGDEVDFEKCAMTHIRYVLPATAEMGHIDRMKLVAVCNEALKVYINKFNSIKDPTKRLVAVLWAKGQLEKSELCDYVISCLGFITGRNRVAASLVAFLALRNDGGVYASLIETFASDIRALFSAVKIKKMVALKERKISDRVNVLVGMQSEDMPYYRYHKNLLNYYLTTDFYRSPDEVDELSGYFLGLWNNVMENK